MFTVTTGNDTSGNRSVPSLEYPTAPRTRSARVTMTVKTGRLIAMAEMFTLASFGHVAQPPLAAGARSSPSCTSELGDHREAARLRIERSKHGRDHAFGAAHAAGAIRGRRAVELDRGLRLDERRVRLRHRGVELQHRGVFDVEQSLAGADDATDSV